MPSSIIVCNTEITPCHRYAKRIYLAVDRRIFEMRRLLFSMIVLTLVGLPGFSSQSKIRRHIAGVDDEFIVVLPASTPTEAVDGIARSLSGTYGLKLKTIWSYSLRGFLCDGPPTAIEALANDPRVDYVEQNVTGAYHDPRTSATQFAWFNGNYLWHLDRLDELSWASRDGCYNMTPEGRSVYAYVIDRGVRTDHQEFETPTRVVMALDFSDDRSNHSVTYTNDTTNGCQGTYGSWHGTEVASSLAGTHVGSAKPQIVSL